MSVSHYGLEKIMGDRLDRIERHLGNIADRLGWIASCHHQQFTPMVEKRPEPFIPAKTKSTSTRPIKHTTAGTLPF
jgi:hypothetical protein